ncbi:MAG: thioredoxin family protein [Proteobacteria bacterium]|nr:thioredoxin family protein [Pseudomonadota bacterium]
MERHEEQERVSVRRRTTRVARRIGPVLAACVALGLAAAGAAAAPSSGASDWSRNDHAAVRLVSAAGALGTGGAGVGAAAREGLLVGLQFQMLPGWKIYWRSPGDAGIPPRVDWSGSTNLAAAEILWPVPERFEAFGLQTMGYDGEVVLPVRVRVADPARTLALRAALDYLVCKEICIPYSHALALELPPGEAGVTPFAHLIERYRARVPGGAADLGLRIEGVRIGRVPSGAALRVAVRSAFPIERTDLIVEGPRGFQFPPPEMELTERERRAILTVAVRGRDAYAALAGQSLTLTLVSGGRAVEQKVEAVAAGDLDAPLEAGLLAMLGLALLGGLILNLMPCVLPVLSIKFLGVIRAGGRTGAEVRVSFLAVAAGIVASFFALAGALVAVKLAGARVGWGIQFQQPLFLAAMVLVLTAFAANLWGWFEVRLPRVVAAAAAGEADGGREARGFLGNFLTGALTTLLATPCSAPFVGPAVGFALARDADEIVAVFALLGVGLAAPYLAVAARPRLVAVLPRPGPWMVWVQRVLGFALAGTAVWLLTILAVQAGHAVAFALAGLALALAGGFFLRHQARTSGLRRALGVALGVVAVAALGLPLAGKTAVRDGGAEGVGPVKWREFDLPAIARLVDEGRVVLVTVSADWCLSCQVNKALVLERGELGARLAAGEVVPMRADWTTPDEAISTYLASFGRYGIPFTAVYGPAAPSGLALAELLTTDEVLDAVERARGRSGRTAGLRR